MKKTRLLNHEISSAIAEMGHTDLIAIVDCGFPIPKSAHRIDISLEKGEPSLLQTLEVLLSELAVEKFFLADETRQFNPEINQQILSLLCGTEVNYLTHDQVKDLVRSEVRTVIRTGEASKYGNVILQSGVVF